MSIEVMSQVMLRYPAGGGERLVALALADNASSDGQRIFPTVEGIARRAFLSTRSVQRHLRNMVASGWLILVRANSGRQGDTNHYRISPEWLAGGECVPPKSVPRRQPAPKEKDSTGDLVSPVKSVDNSPADSDGRVTPEVLTGDTSVTQTVSNHQNTNTPLTPLPARNCGQPRSSGRRKQPDIRTSGLPGKQGAHGAGVMLPRGSRWLRSRPKIEAVGERIGVGRWDQAGYDQARITSPAFAQSRSFAAYTERVRKQVEALREAARGHRHAA